MNEAYREAAAQLEKDIRYLAKAAGLKPGATMVLGCSTSEVAGGRIGKNSVPELGDALAETMIAVCGELGLHPRVSVLRASQPRPGDGTGAAGPP